MFLMFDTQRQRHVVNLNGVRRNRCIIQSKTVASRPPSVFRPLHQAHAHGIQLFPQAMPSPSTEEPTVRTVLTAAQTGIVGAVHISDKAHGTTADLRVTRRQRADADHWGRAISLFMLPRMPNGPGGNISLSCNEPGSCPGETGAGLLYSLLKSVLMTNKLYLDAPIRFAVIMLVNTFFR